MRHEYHIDKFMQNLNKKQRRILMREYERQGNNCCLSTNALCFLINIKKFNFHLIKTFFFKSR